MEKNIFFKIIAIISVMGLTSCVSSPTTISSTSSETAKPTITSSNTVSLDDNVSKTWNKLQRQSSTKLAELQSKTHDPILIGWIQLAMITKQKNINTQQLANNLLLWRERHLSHPANQLFPENKTLMQLRATHPPQQIAVLLPQSGMYGASGQTVREGFLNAYYANRQKTVKQNIKFYDTSQAKNMTALYQQAIAEGADFVIGPLTKEHVQELSASHSLSTTTLALNYSNSQASSNSDKFYEFGLLPEDEANQIADRAHESGLAHALIIAPENAWGKRLVTAFSARWIANGGSIQDSLYYGAQSNLTQDIARLLKVNPDEDKKLMKENNDKTVLEQQRRQDFDVIFLFSQPQQARTIVPLLRYYYVGKTPIYATSAVYSGRPNPIKDGDLNGVIVCDIPWVRKAKETSTNRLYAVGQDAYLLSESLPRLQQLPNFPIYGTTGALSIMSQHQIHRRLPCVAIQNGLLR